MENRKPLLALDRIATTEVVVPEILTRRRKLVAMKNHTIVKALDRISKLRLSSRKMIKGTIWTYREKLLFLNEKMKTSRKSHPKEMMEIETGWGHLAVLQQEEDLELVVVMLVVAVLVKLKDHRQQVHRMLR
jgi:hypothetical protein